MKVNLVLGTITFGQQTFIKEATTMVDTYLESGHTEIDTAYVYNEGKCERMLGQILKDIDRQKYSIATKVNPRISGKLDYAAVNKQLPESLERMGLEYVDIVYLHFPDPETPVESALEALNEQYLQGKFKELGLSNFPAWMVVDVYHKCKQNGWILPTLYEGVYNPLSRKAEIELVDALRRFGIRFYAYNPLAGGMLAGKYKSVDETPTDGRFALRSSYPKRYWKKSFFDAVDILRQELNGINMVEASYRWLAYHSMLDFNKEDAIIVGASSLKQLEENLSLLDNGPLPQNIVQAFETAWEISKADSPEYFTLYKGNK